MILLRENAANHTRGFALTLLKTFNSTTTNSGAATQDVVSFIPAGAIFETYASIVDTIITGCANWTIGTSADTNRYGATLAVAAGTVANPSTYAGDWSPTWGGAARDLRYTAVGGGVVLTTGVVRSELIYMTATNLHA